MDKVYKYYRMEAPNTTHMSLKDVHWEKFPLEEKVAELREWASKYHDRVEGIDCFKLLDKISEIFGEVEEKN